MKMLKRKSLLLMVVVLLVSLVSACSGNNNGGKSNAGNTGASATPTPTVEATADTAEPVEITWWNFPNFTALDGEVGKFEKQIIAAFNEKHPEITVNLEMLTFDGGPEKLNVAIATKTAPDVIYDAPGRIIDWAKKDLLASIDDMFTNEVKADITPAIIEQSSVDGMMYMFPFNTGPFTMAVNKTLFEEIGALDLLPLDSEDRTWTVAEFEAALKAVKEKAPDVIPVGFYAKSQAGDQGTRGFLTNLAGSTFLNDTNDSIALNNEGGVAALEWIMKASKDGLLAPGAASMAASDHNDLFLQGKMAFAINYSAVLKTQFAPNKASDFEDILLPYPTVDGSAPKLEPFLGGLAIFNNEDAAKVEASKKFIDFIVNDPEWSVTALKQTGGLSARNSITGIYEGSEYAYSELARKFITTPPTIADGYAEIRTYWFPALQKVLLNTSSAADALAEFETLGNEAIAKGKAARTSN
ncbi:MAG: extracellular solute-binding protein [Candidatus Pristimantibacillus lignocellulolyticus]|uniref:Extracellular solute-binding protein n=1 Tax=Candidatus Pristimantibacillus lignocellulolyticus TaxID=2994561 RepID=A0A9J6ZH37_9BACL|nr:MAG: extracellular solute-binding protein [Candidatus Pristimantibacillus lignocellulolyticus]